MTLESGHTIIELDDYLFSADRAISSEETKVSSLPLYAGGFDRRILGTQTTLTLEGRYLKAEQGSFFRSIVSYLRGGTEVPVTVGTVSAGSFYAERAVLTENETEPEGKFVFVLKTL